MGTSDTKHRVLFVCVHNSGRSRMAEEWLTRLGGDRYEASSAGFEPSELLPVVREVLEEDGPLHIREGKNPSVFQLYRQGRHFQTVVRVCDAAAAEKCPIFPTVVAQLDWSFPDPQAFEGNREQIKEQVRDLNRQIKRRIEIWLADKA
jgi:arsenate reductase